MDATAPNNSKPIPDCLLRPQLRLFGAIDNDKYADFQAQFDKALAGEGQIGFELTTNGGSADLARRIALDIQIAAEKLGREIFFIGKTIVYSAGVTIMAAFPRKRRYLARDCILLVHERRLEKSVQLSGALPGNLARIKEVENELKIGLDIEKKGFAMLIEGSDVDMDELYEKARENWYVRAEEALERKLIAGIV